MYPGVLCAQIDQPVSTTGIGESEPLMPGILQQINNFVQQVGTRFGIPPSMLLFFTIVAAFLAFTLALLVLRILWAILAVIFGVNRRRRARDPNWARQVRLKELRQMHRWERRE